MRVSSGPFWERVKELWVASSEKEREIVSHSVLLNFRKRIPPQLARHLFDLLPFEIASLSAEPKIAILENKGQRPIQEIDKPEFLKKISEDADVSPEIAQKATVAIFKALRSQLPEKESDQVRAALPAGLKEIWGEKEKPLEGAE